MSKAVREATVRRRLSSRSRFEGLADGPLPSGHGALISAA
jgi:hypothetical protein